MAGVFRSSSRLLRAAQQAVSKRCVSTRGGRAGELRAVLLGGAAVAGAAYGTYKYMSHDGSMASNVMSLKVAHAAGKIPEYQSSVVSQTKDHALYLWINLKPTADAKACARVAANIQKHVDTVVPPADRDEDDEIWAGVGFGPNFYSQVAGKTKERYDYPHRKGALGDMPSSGGDIFIHAKSNSISKLFELCQRFMAQLPKGSVDNFEDIYSFVYRNGRDLSGFIDGTENAADEEDRIRVAVEKSTGGSYVITQKWVHKLDVIDREKDRTLENWVGRSRPDSIEQPKKSISSHVARMTGGNAFQHPKKFEIVRQSMPYGNIHDKAGLFFIGYAESPQNHEFMLDRMVGAGGDPHSDDIMRLSDCIKGTYWYFPGVAELKRLA